MIDSDKIDNKMKPLTDKICEMNLKFGKEVSDELLSRIEVTLDSFFEEFKDISSKSFDYYWKRQEESKNDSFFTLSNQELLSENETANDENSSKEVINTPKFIREYKKKSNKE